MVLGTFQGVYPLGLKDPRSLSRKHETYDTRKRFLKAIRTVTPSRYHHNGLTPPAPPATGNIAEDIANGVTDAILANPTNEQEDIKVNTGFVNEHGSTVYADSDGHVSDHYMVHPDAER